VIKHGVYDEDASIRWHERVLAPVVAVFGLIILLAGVLLISAYLTALDLVQRWRKEKMPGE
jgi:hypothetical protein